MNALALPELHVAAGRVAAVAALGVPTVGRRHRLVAAAAVVAAVAVTVLAGQAASVVTVTTMMWVMDQVLWISLVWLARVMA